MFLLPEVEKPISYESDNNNVVSDCAEVQSSKRSYTDLYSVHNTETAMTNSVECRSNRFFFKKKKQLLHRHMYICLKSNKYIFLY